MVARKFENPTSAASAQMKRQRTRDTALEIAVRKILYARGARYRKHYPVPGLKRRTIDIAFPGPRLAVFLDGCYWHGCAAHGGLPKNNHSAWEQKMVENRQRDAETNKWLESHGWLVRRYWEHSGASDIAADVLRLLHWH